MFDNIIVALEMLVVGMSGVFTVLSIFAFIIWFMKYLDAKIKSNVEEAPILIEQKEYFETRTERELIAVLAAASTSIIGKKVKVKKIHFLDTNSDPASWKQSGLSNNMASHNINIKGK